MFSSGTCSAIRLIGGTCRPWPIGGDVDDRGDAIRGQFAQAADGVGDALGLIPPFLGIVLLHLGGEHEDVLMHQHPAEGGGLHRAARRLDLRH